MKTEDLKAMYARIKARNRGMRQDILAARLGVSRVTLNRWVSGRQAMPETAAILLRNLYPDCC